VTVDKLTEYYERAHAGERDAPPPELVPPDLAWPADRFEAAAHDLAPRIRPGAKVIELAAGDGRLAESLRAGGVDFATYTVLELSRARLTGLRRHLTDERYRFVEGDVEDIRAATADDTYDVVIMLALVEHLIDPMGAMAQIRELLRPGGFVYLETPNIAKWTRRIRLSFGRFPSTASYNEGLTTHGGDRATLYDEGHLHYFTFRSLELMLTERCGFDRIERLGYFNGPYSLPRPVGGWLARTWPTMFSEVALAAYA
jgi:2-polyprenyl-3-methyl-5-hydroxy-6-metoxy-1,4-benzoquinol methylase